MSKLFYSYLFIFKRKNFSQFRTAILTNNTNTICRILDVNRDYIYKELDNTGNTALLLAIKYATPLTVRLLIEQGANPDQSNFVTNQTPLTILASTIYETNQSNEAKFALEIATILLTHGACLDKTSPYLFTDEHGKVYTIQETPLMTAVRTKNLPMAKLFIEKKANVNYTEDLCQIRPIHLAIKNGDIPMFDLLVNSGASCHSVITNENNTLLHWFCYYKTNDEHTSLFKKLINKGCDINAENNNRYTPLMLAAKFDMINTCRVLLNSYADRNKTDNKDYRAIDLTKPDSQCFELLREADYIEENKSHPDHIIDRILWEEKRSLSKSTNNLNEKKIKWYLSNENISSDYEQDNEDIRTKYKHLWKKLIQTRRTKALSASSEHCIVIRL